jgi:hypothetical protein
LKCYYVNTLKNNYNTNTIFTNNIKG